MNTLLIAFACLSIGATFGYCAGAVMAQARDRAPEPYRRIDPGRT